ncbi:unnamed protein product, partial [Prorocentrum cordatum]
EEDLGRWALHPQSSHVVVAALASCAEGDAQAIALRLLEGGQDGVVALARNRFGAGVVRTLLRLPDPASQGALRLLWGAAPRLWPTRYGRTLLREVGIVPAEAPEAPEEGAPPSWRRAVRSLDGSRRPLTQESVVPGRKSWPVQHLPRWPAMAATGAPRRAVRLALVAGTAWHHGVRSKRAAAARLVPTATLNSVAQLPPPPGEVHKREHRESTQRRTARTLKIRSFNAESLRVVGRLDELLRLAENETVAIFTMQSTHMDLGMTWKTGQFEVLSLARSGKGQRDGCLIATNMTHFKSFEVRCEQVWMQGRIHGIRLRSSHSACYGLDIYTMSGYAPTNEPGRPPQGADPNALRYAHLALREALWQACRKAIGQVPARAALVRALDANAHLPPHLPLVGYAGASHKIPTISDTGHSPIDLMEDHGLLALNTSGSTKRCNGAWRSPIGSRAIRSEKRQRTVAPAELAEQAAGQTNLRKLHATARKAWKVAVDMSAAPLLRVSEAARALGKASQRFKDGETVLLRKPKGDGSSAKHDYRAISLIGLVGKSSARAAALDALRAVAHRVPPTQFGAMPGRGTRGAVAITLEGSRIFKYEGGARMTMEELRDGMCYLFRDKLAAKVAEVQAGQNYASVSVYFDPSLERVRTNRGMEAEGCAAVDASRPEFLDGLLGCHGVKLAANGSCQVEVPFQFQRLPTGKAMFEPTGAG